MKRNESRKVISKRLALLLSMILIFTCVVGSTLAYLFVVVGPITNTFEPAKVSCEVSDDLSQVKNTSETSVWLRVSITAVYRSTSDPTTIHWENPTITVVENSNWQQVGDFYYYKSAVTANAAVALPTITVTGSVYGFEIEKQVLAEVIQSAPMDAVHEAWNMTCSAGTWSTYSGS